MSKKKSDNPMQYRVRFASGTSRYFRKRESAEKHFEECKKEYPDEVIVFEDLFANTIIDNYYNTKSTPVYTDCDLCGSQRCPADDEARENCEKVRTSGYVSSDTKVTTSNSYTVTNNTFPYKLYYKDGVLYKEKIEKKKENKFVRFFKKLFKRG